MSDRPQIWRAPAKINLFLHIVGRRDDGYHLLQTAFQFLDFGDELQFRVTDDGNVRRSHELEGVAVDVDLSLRAARSLQRASGTKSGVDITLVKRIPLGGGLGGGSSDAATTLLALNELWGVRMPTDDLAALGLTLGADVPVFIRGRAAWAEGIGEQLIPIDPPEPWYTVVVPPVHVSTAEIFSDFSQNRALTPYTPPRTIRDLREGRVGNDLEPLVRRRHPEVERAFALLASYRPRMTGSGGCVYIEVEDAKRGELLVNSLPAGFVGFVARGMNRHPLSRV
jgi:4-diphosphocytidyl-2-C-methyl-D-erythritol kinase